MYPKTCLRIIISLGLLQSLAACSPSSPPLVRPSAPPSPTQSPSKPAPTPVPTATPDPFASFSPDPDSSDPEISFLSRIQIGAPVGELSCKACDLSYTLALKGKYFYSANLSGSRLRGSDLSGIYSDSSPMACASPAPGESGGCSDGGAIPDWSNTDLRDTRFDEANFGASNFTGADLRGASFRDARLDNVNFTRADMRGADFAGAKIQEIDLLGAQVDPASFKGASMNHVYWAKPLRSVDASDPNSRENRRCYHGLTPDHSYYRDQVTMPCPVSD